MESSAAFTQLLDKYLTHTITGEEQELFLALIRDRKNVSDLETAVAEALETASFDVREDPQLQEALFQRILKQRAVRPAAHRVHFLRRTWGRYAAAVILLLGGIGTYLYIHQKPQKEITLQTTIENSNIQPGGNKAVLTLSDGSSITLDSAANGSLTQQGGTNILKLDAGKLAYQSGNASSDMGYNTLRTPKGGQYQITLTDGSKIWLNAASSVTYPTTFAGMRREITISGEAYLEVAPDNTKPFIVHTAQDEIQVLGTAFNINAYTDEKEVRTTLVEGSIRIKRKSQTAVLKPGQQAAVAVGGKLVVSPARIANVLAWKNGLFNFEGLGVKELMRQLARWYDVEVIYQGAVPDDEFFGEIERNSSLPDLLGRLNKTGINTRLEAGRKLIVLPSE